VGDNAFVVEKVAEKFIDTENQKSPLIRRQMHLLFSSTQLACQNCYNPQAKAHVRDSLVNNVNRVIWGIFAIVLLLAFSIVRFFIWAVSKINSKVGAKKEDAHEVDEEDAENAKLKQHKHTHTHHSGDEHQKHYLQFEQEGGPIVRVDSHDSKGEGHTSIAQNLKKYASGGHRQGTDATDHKETHAEFKLDDELEKHAPAVREIVAEFAA